MFKVTDFTLAMGIKGSGKTYLSRKVQSFFPKVVVIDTMNEYHDGLVFSDFDSFCETLLEFKKNRKKVFRLIFKFSPETKNKAVIFDNLLRILFKCGNLCIVIEEVHMYSSPHKLPQWLENCVLIGRHRNLSMVFTSQRPGEINKTILSQCQHVFCGRAFEKNDIDYQKSFLGFFANNLKTMKKRMFIYFSPDRETLLLMDNDLKTGLELKEDTSDP